MKYVGINEELSRLNEAGDWGRAYQLADLHLAWPDLTLHQDHWGQLKYCSAEANPEVDIIEMDSCHSCEGQPIKLWTYAHIDPKGTRLYSDPPVFLVADQNPNGFGVIPRVGWVEALEAAGLSRSVIVRVRDHLSRHPPISYREADDAIAEADPDPGAD